MIIRILKVKLNCLLIFLTLSGYSQDQIITKKGGTIPVRVIEEGKKMIYYYPWTDDNNSIQQISKKEVRKIRMEDPPDGTNSIVIMHTSLSGKDLFSNITTYLLQAGYQIEKFDTDLLKVVTKFESNHRLLVDIDDNVAEFICYRQTSETKDKTISTGAENVIRLQPREKSEDESDEFPGEEICYSNDSEFKRMNRICRKYLMNNKATLNFSSN